MTNSNNTLYSYDDFAEAIRDIRKQYEAGKPLVWNGPNEFHSSIMCSAAEPSWHFSPEGIEYHAEHDRDFFDICMQVTSIFGNHQGIVSCNSEIDRLNRRNEVIQARSDMFEKKWLDSTPVDPSINDEIAAIWEEAKARAKVG